MIRDQTNIDFKLKKINGCKLHSIEVHNLWIERGYGCPFCLIGFADPVPKCMIEGAYR